MGWSRGGSCSQLGRAGRARRRHRACDGPGPPRPRGAVSGAPPVSVRPEHRVVLATGVGKRAEADDLPAVVHAEGDADPGRQAR
jgi:hypothetical protein